MQSVCASAKVVGWTVPEPPPPPMPAMQPALLLEPTYRLHALLLVQHCAAMLRPWTEVAAGSVMQVTAGDILLPPSTAWTPRGGSGKLVKMDQQFWRIQPQRWREAWCERWSS